MGLSTPAATRIAAGGLLSLLLLLSFSSPASAQLPPEVASQALHLGITCNGPTLLEPDYAGQAEVTCTLRDYSRDSVFLPDSTSGTSPTGHQVVVTTRPVNESIEAKGWQTEPKGLPFFMVGGDAKEFIVRAKTTPIIDTQDYHFELVVDYTHQSGYNRTFIVPFTAEVNRYDFALLSWAGPLSQKAGQDDVVTYTLAITNTGVYPDSYRFTVTSALTDVYVSQPPNLFVPPGETRTTNITVLTPHGKIYEIGRTGALSIKVNSMTGSGAYSATAVLQIRGAYVPTYWIPLLLVGLVSASVVVRGSREKAQARALERGRPRRVEITPRQTVLLAELRRTDPEAYREKKRSLDSVYKERLTDYRAHRKERLAADREEARQARAEFQAAKKARRAKRAEEKRAAKLRRAEEKRAAKIARKEAKREAKLVKKKEKVLGKKRAKLEKERAKAEAREAKAAAKQAKLDAKALKREQAAAKKAEKEARKKT